MFSKLLAPIAIFSLIAVVGFLGYTTFVDAEGKGWQCQGLQALNGKQTALIIIPMLTVQAMVY